MRTSAFTASRLTPTVFKVVENDDIYDERPFIYVKSFNEFLVVMDTGCGGATKKPNVDVTSLRTFIETWPLADNSNQPLNPDGKKGYVVVCSHCHYDHILGVEQFADSPILASSHSPSFLSLENRAKNTLCERLGIRTPTYNPILKDHLAYITDFRGLPTGLRILHTPGHTPDELALWDESERMLYVGDTVYEWAPIIFPPEGSIVEWFSSMDALLRLVELSESQNPESVRINCGHVTAARNAREVLGNAKGFMEGVLKGTETLASREKDPSGAYIVYYQRKDMRYSLRCSEQLVLEARSKLGIIS